MPDRCVLLVDGDADFRERVTPVLEELGLRVVAAGAGSEALLLLERERPELAITGAILSDTSGVDWIAEVRRRGDDRPILYLSSDSPWGGDAPTIRRLTGELRV